MSGLDLVLLARMTVRAKPSQLVHRARLRSQRMALRHSALARRWLLAGPIPSSAAGWPQEFHPIDRQLWHPASMTAALRNGRIDLLGTTRRLAPVINGRSIWPDWSSADWAQAAAPMLWRFHLHYWDWAWALAAEPDREQARTIFASIWQSWRAATHPGHGDPWLPYPAALRAWSWCGLYLHLVAESAIEKPFLASLAAHAGFVRRHLELDLGGNHLIKGLKATTGLAVFFGDERTLQRALDLLSRQLAVQVLPDGGHFERAPAYHCQVLADLIDLAELLQSADRTPPTYLTKAILRMREWLGDVLLPQGEVPLLNDGYPVNPALVRLLEPTPTPATSFQVLADTGLVRAAAGSWYLLADVGVPCPDELPGHAHADTFGCLTWVDGVPLLVDTGTLTYEAGPVRDYQRSTAAHNTVEVDGADSTEVWGAFRAARRAQVTGLTVGRITDGSVVIEAAHDGFRRLPGRPWHRRRWSLSETGLLVSDLITGTGVHTVTVRWHLPPGAVLQLHGGVATVRTSAGQFRVAVTGPPTTTLFIESAQLATGFSRTVTAPVLIGRVRAQLPVRISTSWQRSAPAERPTAEV